MKITPAQSQEIQDSTESAKALAERYNVNVSTIYDHKARTKRPDDTEDLMEKLTTPAIQLIIEIKEEADCSYTKAIASILNWTAASAAKGINPEIEKSEQSEQSFAQKIRAKLNFTHKR